MDSTLNSVVVVGAGQAGCQTADSLRQLGYRGAIHLVGEEPYLPYQRPPLSKKFLAGELSAQRLSLRPEAFYEKHKIDTRIGVQASLLDPHAQTLTLSNGEQLNYDRLALCTGARVFKLQVPGTELPGVHYLRTIADVELIKQQADNARHIVIIGGGFIGLETAAVLWRMGKTRGGCSVTVVEMQDRVMGRAVSPWVSQFFEDLHISHGVNLRLRHGVVALQEENDQLAAVALSNGERLAADLCIVGAGVLPNVGLADHAGLHCEDGIVVDEHAKSSHTNIVAAGDCTNHPNTLLGRRLRLESVHNAIEQAKTAAASILGLRQPYRQYPWFWSDQYHVKLQMVGISHGYETIVTRGDPDQQQFSLFYFSHGSLIAVDSVNRPGDHMQARRLLNEGIPITPEQAADTTCDLKLIK